MKIRESGIAGIPVGDSEVFHNTGRYITANLSKYQSLFFTTDETYKVMPLKAIS